MEKRSLSKAELLKLLSRMQQERNNYRRDFLAAKEAAMDCIYTEAHVEILKDRVMGLTSELRAVRAQLEQEYVAKSKLRRLVYEIDKVIGIYLNDTKHSARENLRNLAEARTGWYLMGKSEVLKILREGAEKEMHRRKAS